MNSVLRRRSFKANDPVPDLKKALFIQDNGNELVYWDEESYPTQQCTHTQADIHTPKNRGERESIEVFHCVLVEEHEGSHALFPTDDPALQFIYRR